MRFQLFCFVALLSLACAPTQLPRSTEPVDLVVATTTDVHGRVRAWDYYANQAEAVRGLTRTATIVDSVRTANPGRVILLDGGDLLQGNPLAYVAARLSRDRTNPIIAAMNAMQYDAAAIGNHEYNYGVPYLDSAIRQAKFPFLSANTYRINPEGIHAYRPWVIIERAGLRVGIVGATTPGVMVWDAENIKGRLRFGDIVPAVRQAVGEVRAAGADIVLVTVHSGLNEPASYDTVTTGAPSENVAARIAAEVPGISLVIYGHSHKEVRGTTIGQTLLVQPKNWATSVNVVHLLVSPSPDIYVNMRVPRRYVITEKRSDLVQAAGHAENAAVLAATDAVHRETVAYVTTPIGTTPERWSADSARVKDTPLIDFILETERKAAGSDLASTAAFSTELVMGPGPITIAQVAQLYPYDNTLRAVRITGKQLRDYLEFSSRYYRTPASATVPLETDPQIPGYNFDVVSGVDYVIDVSRPIGSRITRLDYKGAPVRDSDSFTMALNNYRQTGGGGYAMLSGAPVVYDRQQEIRQLLIDEVKLRDVLRQADYFTANWRIARGGQATVSPTAPPVTQPTFPAGTRFLRIIATNDFHGALEPRPDAAGVRRGGAAYVAAAIERARSECAPNCETLLLDGGDLFQGTPASNLSYGRPVVDYYNRMGYAASALGNHEFDWGIDTLRARMRQARFGIFGANVRYTDGRDVKWIRNDTIVSRGRTRIGIIGVSTVNTPTTTRAANVVGLRFDDPAPIVDSIGRSLRSRGADFVVVIAHAGAFCDRPPANTCNGEIIDLARKVTTKVDAIVSGHTHSLVNTVVNGIPIVQARSSGRAIDVLDLPLGAPALAARHEVRELASDTIRPLASIDSIVQRAVARVAPLVNRHVATIPLTLTRQGTQYPLGNLIADAQRWAAKGDVAIMNNGGIRTELRAGDATYGSLFEIQPFGNTLYSLTMTGDQLRGLLEAMLGKSSVDDHVSGLTIRYDPSKPKGSRIVSVTMSDGTPLSGSRSYNVIVNDFLATGGAGYNAGGRATASKPTNVVDLDALIDYLKSLPSPIVAPAEVRIAPVTQ
jgi:2',3'-cyclic-nucleotide 2'-phosphodiesterase (5'-nucleotidase family)